MTTKRDVARAREPVLTAALKVLVAERRLLEPSAVAKLINAEAELIDAARAFVAVADELEPAPPEAPPQTDVLQRPA